MANFPYKIQLLRGLSYIRQMRLKHNNAAINLTDSEIKFYLCLTNADDSIISLSSSNAPDSNGSKIEITDTVNGRFKLTITPLEISNLSVTTGRWWLSLKDSLGNKKRIGFGTFEVINP